MDKITESPTTIDGHYYVGYYDYFWPLTIDMYVPSLPNVQSDFGTTTSQVQLTLSFAMIDLQLGNLHLGHYLMHMVVKIALLIISIYVIASLIAVFTTSLSHY